MLNQLQALETDCDLLEGELQEVQERRRQKQDRVLQRLRLENEVQKQEIDKLKDIIQQGREEKPTPPSTEPLEQQAAELRKEASALQLRRAGGQASVEQQSRALREEIAALEDRLQKTTSQKEVMEDVLEGLKCSHGSRELHRDQDLDKERVRSERRIQVLDTKILSLQQEAEDLRERASVVMKSKPPPDAILDSEVWRWQTAEQKQREVQELRREESKQQREQELALRDLEAAKVEASVLERKIRALGVQAREPREPIPSPGAMGNP
ncbi:unnamed protein product [Effrenium voratum]|nr:unnamed protein product [Effrenium voratum]